MLTQPKMFPDINTRSFVAPKPFLKWAGGKSQLLPQIKEKLPDSFKHNTFSGKYYEPFMGSAAVFFNLSPSLINTEAFISDINFELVNTFLAVQNHIEDLIEALREYEYLHNVKYASNMDKRKEFYYSIRELDRQQGWMNIGNKQEKIVAHAARFIYLNRTCFNGLWRVNSQGYYNVPMGSYKKPTICNEAVLRNAHKALQNVSIKHQTYKNAVLNAKANDLVYFDPPYMPLSKTSSFNAYAKDAFLEREHKELAIIYLYLAFKGVRVILSNSDTDFTNLPLGPKTDKVAFEETVLDVLESLEGYSNIPIDDLYASYKLHWNIDKVSATRAINSQGASRGAITEILVYSCNENEENNV